MRKVILGRVLDIAVRKVFSSNAYTFAGRIRIQSDGAPIGLDLSGDIGRLEMGDWDTRMAELCVTNCVEVAMSDRYVDDVDTIMKAIPHGYRWTGHRVKYNWQWELEDEKIPLDQHTVSIMVAIANTIRPAIQMEGDYGSRHEDGYIPVLDLKMNTVLVYVPGDP